MTGGFFYSRHPEDKSVIILEVEDKDGNVAKMVAETALIDTIIHELGNIRATMTPAHPRTLEPNPVFRDTTRGTLFHVGRPHAVSRELFIAVLHPGFGWLAFPMVQDAAHALAVRIAKEVVAASGQKPPSLLGPDGKPLA